MWGLLHGWRLAGDARQLARHGALRPFETHPDLPAPARMLARLLRFGTGAPVTPDYAGGLKACGPAAVKLGQALATRPDLVGDAVAADLAALQDDLPPARWQDVEAVLEQALPGGWRAHFSAIDEQPTGSASVAQVHRAVLLDGRAVALKVLRPNVEAEFAAAIASYAWAAARLERLGGEFERLRLQQAHELVFPQPVQAARHQVVHQVIARSHPPEDVADGARLLLWCNIAKAQRHKCIGIGRCRIGRRPA